MMSCQVSLYPLGTKDYEKIVLEAVKNLPEEGVEVDLNPMSTLLRGEDEKVWEAVKSLYKTGKNFGDLVMVITLSNRCGAGCKKS
ncbi:MAG: Ykof family thiamine-binding protein [Tepidanaerobacteraceae bacterium]|nr:Ykof family thiamine-binding protein [Tepidanaerobacteraceae bacterium]